MPRAFLVRKDQPGSSSPRSATSQQSSIDLHTVMSDDENRIPVFPNDQSTFNLRTLANLSSMVKNCWTSKESRSPLKVSGSPRRTNKTFPLRMTTNTTPQKKSMDEVGEPAMKKMKLETRPLFRPFLSMAMDAENVAAAPSASPSSVAAPPVSFVPPTSPVILRDVSSSPFINGSSSGESSIPNQ